MLIHLKLYIFSYFTKFVNIKFFLFWYQISHKINELSQGIIQSLHISSSIYFCLIILIICKQTSLFSLNYFPDDPHFLLLSIPIDSSFIIHAFFKILVSFLFLFYLKLSFFLSNLYHFLALFLFFN
jgi:hypothetical protein